MRILVGVKRVIDYAVKVRVAADKKGTCLCGQMGREGWDGPPRPLVVDAHWHLSIAKQLQVLLP